jgi:predicted TIM-barrel fold metal-dependent hydrolase
MNRKKFLASASVLALASLRGNSLLAASLSNPSKPLPLIDTHQHLADLVRFGKGWTSPPVPGNYDMKAYMDAVRNVNMVKAVYMEVAVPVAKRHEEALYAIEMCKDTSNPTVAAVISANLMSPDFESYISQFKGSEYIKGIRYGFKSVEEMKNPLLIKNVEVLGKLDMSLDFTISPAWLPAVAELIKTCPGTRFLVNHCGNADPRAFLDPSTISGKPNHDANEWIASMKTVAENKNVVCKISGIISVSSGYPKSAETLAPGINHCLDIFGPNRVMFASDWPWCLKGSELENWVNILKEIVKNRPYKEQKKLFHDNAVKFYNI